MLCSTICPNDALLPDVDISILLFNNLPISGTITFTCKHQQQYEDDEVVMPCLATLPAEALLYLCIARVPTTFFFNAKRCSTCPNQKSFQIFKEIFETVSHATREFATSSLILQTHENDPPSEQSTRRVFLKSIKNAISSQRRNEDKARVEEGQSNPCNRSITKRRKIVKEAKKHISPSQRTLFSKLTENRMSINESCTPCNRCSGICPTGALRLQKSPEKKELEFSSEKCSGCGLCSAFCKHESISLILCHISHFPLGLIEVKQS